MQLQAQLIRQNNLSRRQQQQKNIQIIAYMYKIGQKILNSIKKNSLFFTFFFSLIDFFSCLYNSIQSMQITLDQYVRNFRIFYQQLIKGHSKQQHLNKQFKGLIQNELKKWRKGYGISKISETSTDNQLLNKVRENRKNKQQSKLNIQPYYSSEKVENCVVFGYLYLVLEYKNVAAFQFLQEQLKGTLNDKQAYSAPAFRKINYVWNKLDEIIYGKRRVVRFQKQLQEYFKELPQIFLDLIYKAILQDKVLIVQNKTLYFEQLSQFLTLKVEYFEVNQQQNLKINTYGEKQKYSIKIGYLKQQNQYVNVGRLPQKQDKQLNKQITIQKFEQISKALNQMYMFNMKEYMNLSNLKTKAESNPLNDSRQRSMIRHMEQTSLDSNSQFVSI